MNKSITLNQAITATVYITLGKVEAIKVFRDMNIASSRRLSLAEAKAFIEINIPSVEQAHAILDAYKAQEQAKLDEPKTYPEWLTW